MLVSLLIPLLLKLKILEGEILISTDLIFTRTNRSYNFC